jgi:hypothetical protein
LHEGQPLAVCSFVSSLCLLADSLKESFQRLRNHMIWLFTQLTVKPRIVVSIHAALEDHRVNGAIKEARCNTQSPDLISRHQILRGFVEPWISSRFLRLPAMI